MKYVIYLVLIQNSLINLYDLCWSPPPKKTGRFEYSQSNYYLSDDYSDDEEENLHSKW